MAKLDSSETSSDFILVEVDSEDSEYEDEETRELQRQLEELKKKKKQKKKESLQIKIKENEDCLEECKETSHDSQDLPQLDSGSETEQIVTETVCKEMTSDLQDLPNEQSASENVKDTVVVVDETTSTDGDSDDEQDRQDKLLEEHIKLRQDASNGFDIINGNQKEENKERVVGATSFNRNQGETIRKTEIKSQQNDISHSVQNPIVFEDHLLRSYSVDVGLERFYPGQLQLSEVTQIVSKTKNTNLKQIGMYFIRTLVIINSNCRDKMIKEFLAQISKTSESVEEENNDDFLDQLLGNVKEDISPLDLIHCVFRCSSPILQQAIASKLFMCKLAVPIILPVLKGGDCQVSIWPLRSITIESKSSKGITQDNAVTSPCHVVSFVRMGRPAFSKSKLLNEIIYEQKHSTFFNKDCALGTAKRVISDGLVEIGWLLPSKTSSIFNNATMFLNLRGDGFVLKDQMKLLLNISNVVVIVIDAGCLCDTLIKEQLIKFRTSHYKTLLAIDAKGHQTTFLKKHLHLLINDSKSRSGIFVLSNDSEDKSTAIIKEEVSKHICNLLKTQPVTNLSSRIKKSKIKTDEDTPCFKESRQNAEKLNDQIPNITLVVKDEQLPLQGKLWRSYSKTLKELKKSSLNLSLEEQTRLESKMHQYRVEQANLCKNLGSFMKLFLSSLKNLKDSENEMSIFITWLKLYLDERSRESMLKFRIRYESDLRNLNAMKDQNYVDSNKRKSLQNAVHESERHLTEASFGFEHLCREMGQIFEALKITEAKKHNLVELKKDLTDIAVNLILLGQPFEILDGDAGNVPIHWVEAVFECLSKRVENKRVIALSVLGIQSSGKSTLLNAMFGVQFAVSAGKCTRGVFMQMVAVETNTFPFDFILVIDAEGLCASELWEEKYSHDNELATFVLGLADITIVNIRGENAAEIQDVLEIAVHAFLRLQLANQKLKLKQKCIFIHQNVPALDSNEKLVHARQKFIEKLDIMTKEAADQENISDIQSFSQVIDFDIDENVWYFPHFWHGDPPMAPVNPGYSEHVSLVKDDIVYQITNGGVTYFTIRNTFLRIRDLWEGLLKDDFVLCFRNCRELKAYIKIEKTCQAMIWELEKNILEFVQTTARQKLLQCNNEVELDSVIMQIMDELNIKTEQLESSFRVKLDSYIDTHWLKDIMIQWKQGQINRIRLKKQELIEKARTEINRNKEKIRIQRHQAILQRENEIKINKKACKLAKKMKGEKPSDEVMKNMFEEMWEKWLSQCPAESFDDNETIDYQIKCAVYESNQPLRSFINDDRDLFKNIGYTELTKLEGSFPIELITPNCISVKTKMKDRKLTQKYSTEVLEIINMIFRKIDTKLNLHLQEDYSFNIFNVNDIFLIIDEEVTEHNKKSIEFNLPSPMQSKLICHVANYASMFYQTRQYVYNEKHSLHKQMQHYKETVWSLFKNTVHCKREEIIAMDFFKKSLLKITLQYVRVLLPSDVQEVILSQFPNGKYSLMKNILSDENVWNDFNQILSYIKDSNAFAANWVETYLYDFLFDTKANTESSKYCILAEKRTNAIFVNLEKSVRHAIKSKDVGIENWIDCFVGHVIESTEMPLTREDFIHVKERNIEDSTTFGRLVLEALDEIKMSVLKDFSTEKKNTVEWTKNPVSGVIESLRGCTEKCMFCKEPCMNTDRNHTTQYPHRCLQHRPVAFSGWILRRSDRLVVHFCDKFVQSNEPYRLKNESHDRLFCEYKEDFPHWDIAPYSEESRYWKWLLCMYTQDFAKHYKKRQPEIPKCWRSISKEEALQSLDVTLNVRT